MEQKYQICNRCVMDTSDVDIKFDENGFIACNSVGVEKYSRRLQTEELAKLVKQITA